MIDLRASLDPARTYLLGLSGGRDSVALLHLLHQQGFAKIIPCHLNHQLRGAEAEKDAHFVAELCQSLAYPLESASCDVAARAESKKNSLETAARSARRQFFARCAEKFACPRLLLAHHADDQAETLLFNLLRGSASLRGMSPESRQVIGGQDMTLLRPLLTVRRAEIDHFITANKLRYREDATNASDFATRNRLRHQALPLLADILDRDPVPALLRHAAQARAEAEFLDQHLDSLELRDPQGRLFLPKLRELPPFLQKRALHRFLRDHDTPQLSSKLVEQALDLIAPEAPPALTLPGGSRLRRRQARLFIEDTL